MALHFGKRETEQPKPLSSGMATPRYGAATPSAPQQPQATPEPTPPVSTPAAAATSSASTAPEGGSKLTVGPNIKLKGVEITDCDTLV
ncbi:MAG TPA: polymer-forming cytoskeletal protein, partial [Hydrogenophaga sp.]|nr:polymer-forming cytoskeletal protein [Hydrogenophaga sp.]